MAALAALKSLRKEEFTYTKQYCEVHCMCACFAAYAVVDRIFDVHDGVLQENVYLLAQQLQERGLGEKGWVVFISNPLRTTPFYNHVRCDDEEMP